MDLEVVVRAVHKETNDIACFELMDADGGALPGFSAGAHIDVHVADGLVRQYSLCNSPAETGRYVIGVLKDPASRGGSAALHDFCAQGSRLRIGEARNLFPLVETADHTILFAGGIGITPLLAMAERLTTLGRSFEMHYCGRALSRMAFLNRIATSPFREKVHIHCDDGPQDQLLDLSSLMAEPKPNTHLYTCGPSGFMEHVLDYAACQGWPEAQVHKEYFGAPTLPHESDAAFEIKIAGTDAVVPVKAGQTAVSALTSHGFDIPVSCEQGVCGTCLTKVVEGIPDHRDCFLTATERAANNAFLPCCSRSRSPRLIVEL